LIGTHESSNADTLRARIKRSGGVMKGVKPLHGSWMSPDDIAKQDSRIPVWQAIPVRRAMDQLEGIMHALNLSESGIRQASKLPLLVKALQPFGSESAEKDANEIARSERIAERADAEIAREFFHVRSLVVIGIWSVLETMAKDTVVAFVRNDRKFYRNDEFMRLNIQLGEYLNVPGRERAEFIVDAMEKKLNGAGRIGLGRFNILLKAVGVHVNLQPDAEKSLLELQQVRNCIAHRTGTVDRRLKEVCPWIPARLGSQLQVERADMQRYFGVAHQLVLETFYGIVDLQGLSDDFREKTRRKLAKMMRESEVLSDDVPDEEAASPVLAGPMSGDT
jgi:hypothetical protein